MTPSLNRRRWIFIIVFWVIFLASIGLVRRYEWIDLAWNGLWLLLVIVGGFYSVREMFRRGDRTGQDVYTRGVPRCLWWIVMDDEEYDRRTRTHFEKDN